MPARFRCPHFYAHEARLLLRFLGEPPLAEQVGIDPAQLEDPDGTIPILSYYDLIEAAVEFSQDPLLGLRLGSVDMGDARPGAGAVGMLFFASPTARVSVTKLSEYQHCWNPGERIDISVSTDELYMRYRCWGPSRPAHHQLALRNAASFMGILRLIDSGLTPNWMRIDMQRPEGSAEVEALLSCPVEWDAGANEAASPLGRFESPLPSADPDLFRYAESLVEQQLSDVLESPCYTALVRDEIKGQSLGDSDALAPLVATRLGYSGRTLQRRLSEEGTSFRELIDEERRVRSLDLLRTDEPLGEIAERLGYTESTSLRQAFQRWYGRSPAAWRDRDRTLRQAGVAQGS